MEREKNKKTNVVIMYPNNIMSNTLKMHPFEVPTFKKKLGIENGEK